MISRISGKIIEKGSNYLVLDTGAICYEVLIPQTVMQRLDEGALSSGSISLKVFHYLQVEPSKTFPVLIGFLNDIEKDFFEVFITVSGIGPKAALRALSKPISQIAKAIDEADIGFLKSLPGIGGQRAKEIIAKLQNKVGRFGLIQDGDVKVTTADSSDIMQDALAVLTQLGYKRQEALNMIKQAQEASGDIESTEELLNIVYKQKRSR